MNTTIKQALHVDAVKSFGAAEAAENERRWTDDKMDQKNEDPTNHYDKSRRHLNFEIGPDGAIHPLGYHARPLHERLMDRLAELGWHPFKADSKIQPNCCARFVFGGNHDRTLEMAFGNQPVNLDKEADNSHLHRCTEIEQWAKDVYDWCARRYGQENIIGFQVHLDETSPHIHALIVPVGARKNGRACVMWSARFGKNRFERAQILREMHTSLYEEVGSRYGLERGDSIEGRQVQHLHKRDYIRTIVQQTKQAERAVKGLQTMIRRLEAQILRRQQDLERMEEELPSGRIALQDYESKRADIQRQLAACQIQLEEKTSKLNAKQHELECLTKDVERVGAVVQPFRNHKVDFSPPQITSRPPMFGVDKWLEAQNRQIAECYEKAVRQLEALYHKDAERQVQAAQCNALVDYKELGRLRQEHARLTDYNENLTDLMRTFLDQLAEPSVRERVFTLADALIAGSPVVPSGGGGGSSDSDLRWDGRNPDEEEETYRRRCLLHAAEFVHKDRKRSLRR